MIEKVLDFDYTLQAQKTILNHHHAQRRIKRM